MRFHNDHHSCWYPRVVSLNMSPRKKNGRFCPEHYWLVSLLVMMMIWGFIKMSKTLHQLGHPDAGQLHLSMTSCLYLWHLAYKCYLTTCLHVCLSDILLACLWHLACLSNILLPVWHLACLSVCLSYCCLSLTSCLSVILLPVSYILLVCMWHLACLSNILPISDIFTCLFGTLPVSVTSCLSQTSCLPLCHLANLASHHDQASLNGHIPFTVQYHISEWTVTPIKRMLAWPLQSCLTHHVLL